MDSTNIITWFEIPVNDSARARKFYAEILDVEFTTQEMMGFEMSFFPMVTGVSGALVKGENFIPSTEGTNVYLNANPDIQTVIDKIEPAGGKVLMQRTLIADDIGYMAIFLDSEGNRISLHATN